MSQAPCAKRYLRWWRSGVLRPSLRLRPESSGIDPAVPEEAAPARGGLPITASGINGPPQCAF